MNQYSPPPRRLFPYLCRAVRNFVVDHADFNVEKEEYYISIVDLPTRHKWVWQLRTDYRHDVPPSNCRVRELSTEKVGSLLRISGQVVRTHPVHPELVSGTFMCLECQAIVTDVLQQFKYSPVSSHNHLAP